MKKTPNDPNAADALAQRLAALGLPFMREHYQAHARLAAEKNWSHVDYLAELANGEAAWHRRQVSAMSTCSKWVKWAVLK